MTEEEFDEALLKFLEDKPDWYRKYWYEVQDDATTTEIFEILKGRQDRWDLFFNNAWISAIEWREENGSLD